MVYRGTLHILMSADFGRAPDNKRRAGGSWLTLRGEEFGPLEREFVSKLMGLGSGMWGKRSRAADTEIDQDEVDYLSGSDGQYD